MPARTTIKLGDRFGKLVVIALSDQKTKSSEYVWQCLCDCGKTCYRTSSKLKLCGGCGCLRGKDGKHGMYKSPEHTAWRSMQNRCYNLKDDSYKNYGAKGVTVCDEWRAVDGFERFFAHIGPRPSDEHSVDRYPNKFGNYEPGNVRWGTPEEQQRNRVNNTLLTLGDETKTLVEWSQITGIHRATISSRKRQGHSDEQALSIPKRPYNKSSR